ncbi:MAG TPA: hypothetical protein PLW37_01670 [bacterium]|nr:hypothetical protein [bacterium]
MLPVILAAGGILTTIVSTVCSTARDMNADRLITNKELAEIEAKSKAFSEMISLKGDQIDKSFRLEMEIIGLAKEYLKMIQNMSDKIMILPDNSPKIHTYDQQISCFLNSIDALVRGDAKYFKDLDFGSFDNGRIEFNNPTKIGTSSTNYRKDEKPHIGNIIEHDNYKKLKD